VVAVIQDADVIQKFIDNLKEKKVNLADGHHQYESSLAYKNERKNNNPDHTGAEGYNFHLMYLNNTKTTEGDVVGQQTLPQKSPFSYPKVICGLLFTSIKEDEFKTPPYSRF